MKAFRFIILSVATIAMVSCGTAKKAQQSQYQEQYPNYGGYQPQPAPGYYQQQPMQQPQSAPGFYQQPQAPTADELLRQEQEKMARENPCQYLAMQWPDNEIRAYGVATGFDEEAALTAARINAESELNSVMNLWASDFTRRTNTAAQKNGHNNQERLTQQDQIRFAEGDLKGVQVLLVKYEKVNGGVQCRMCVTMNATAATNALLSQAEVQGIIKNAEAFREEADKSREEIRLMRTGTNAEMKKKQAEQNMQIQMNDQRYQQNQQSVQQQQNYNLQQQQQYYNYQIQQNQQNQQYNQQQQYNQKTPPRNN